MTEPTTPETYGDAVRRLAAQDPSTTPAAVLSAQLAEAGRRELAAARRPVALVDRRDGLEVATITAAALPPVPAPLPRTVDDARALVVARLAEIRDELAELADALGTDDEAGQAGTRALHALAAAIGYADQTGPACPACGTATVPPTPGTDEAGNYCEPCGRCTT